MRELEVRRVGPMTPLEVQLRRVETRTAFLELELDKLAELVEVGADPGDIVDPLAARLERMARLVRSLEPDRLEPEP